jgi:hypothetical protein
MHGLCWRTLTQVSLIRPTTDFATFGCSIGYRSAAAVFVIPPGFAFARASYAARLAFA